MGEFFLDSEVVRVCFQDDNWVDVKEELTQADQDYIMGQMVKGEVIKPELGRIPLLERSIVAWSFPEPVNRENIIRLRVRYRVKLLNEINRLNEQALEFVSKNL